MGDHPNPSRPPPNERNPETTGKPPSEPFSSCAGAVQGQNSFQKHRKNPPNNRQTPKTTPNQTNPQKKICPPENPYPMPHAHNGWSVCRPKPIGRAVQWKYDYMSSYSPSLMHIKKQDYSCAPYLCSIPSLPARASSIVSNKERYFYSLAFNQCGQKLL